MPLNAFNTRNNLLILALLFFFFSVKAQEKYNVITSRIDSMANVGLPKSAMKLVDTLDELARKNNNALQQIRAAIYRMTFQSYLEENVLEAIINRLKTDIKHADYPVKPVLQSLLAQMYWKYYQENRYKISQRSKLQQADTLFTNWDIQSIISETGRLYALSLSDAQKEQNTPIGILNGVLEGDSTTRYLRPTLYDLLAQRSFDFFLKDEATINKPRLPFSLADPRFFGDSKTFATLEINTTDTSSTVYKGMVRLQQATLFHLQKHQDGALADIDLKRLEFLYANSNIAGKDSLYLNALQKVATDFSSGPISADALVLQGRYYLQTDSLKTALTFFTKAVATYPESLAGKNAANFIKQIHQTELSANTEDVNTPGKPLLATLNYRNVKTARVTIYKIWATQYNELDAMKDDRYGTTNGYYIQPITPVMDYLKKLKPLKVESLQLPGTDDYKKHTTEFKIGPLQTGIYVLIVEDPLNYDPEALQFSSFRVTRLSFVTRHTPNGKTQINAIDRETGAPLPGVQITAEETQQQTTDANGSCFFDLNTKKPFAVKLTTETDTLYSGRRYRNGIVYNNDSRNTERTILFTDREIYRPGQAVYFKGLCINKQNGKNTLLVNAKRSVIVQDNYSKQIVTLPVVTNEFGSFSGTFIIPQNILNGSVSIYTPTGVKFIQVEDYKRPSFLVDFLPIKNSYKPNDSVTIKGTVRAYSGYGLSQARIAYHITRHINIFNYRSYRSFSNRFNTTEISADTVKTNDRGEFEIKFKAIVDGVADKNLRYNFNINADATDGSGETRSANSLLTIAVNNLLIAANLPAQASASDNVVKISAAINNLNNISQSGEIKLKIYSLKQPAQFYKNRLWNKPDCYLLSKEEYKTDFPEFSYGEEDNKDTWPVHQKLAELTLETDGKAPAVFDSDLFKKQPTGTYRLVFNARNLWGDTVSETRYLDLLNKPAQPHSLNNWVSYLNKGAEKKDFAEFWVGTGRPAHVLMEKFNDTVLLSSQWLTIQGGGQQVIKISTNPKENITGIQFLMAFQNRLYLYHRSINQINNNGLNIKFLTFRNKLQPGEKEQWKLQISDKNNELQVAEMVADLYDVSLDAISSPYSWNSALRTGNNYTPLYYSWGNEFTSQSPTHALNYKHFYFNPTERSYERLQVFDYRRNSFNKMFASVESLEVADPGLRNLNGYNNNDVTIDQPVGGALREVVVPGLQTTVKTDTIEYKASRYKMSNLPADILKNVQIIDDNGDQANITRNTITTRANFAETAFFYPQLQTNEKGEILIDFTIPEALTRWRFRGFAHTKDLSTGYIENTIVTQKQLSISANTPRFLREGDTITISARMANLTAGTLKGKVDMKLFNALNMQPVSLFADKADAEQTFEVAGNTNKAVSFRLVIPAGLDALTYRLTADAGEFTDGEENTLPVLPNRMLVTESMPMMVRAGQTRDFTFEKLVRQNSPTLKNKTLSLEYTQNPAWYAVQALPYMMEFPYECSEQVFSRYYANSLASNIVNKMPAIKRVFDQWKNNSSGELLSNLEKNQELKLTLLEETPWLNDAISESEQKKRIALLFDLNKMSDELKLNLDKLQKRQLPDGGFTWFGGDRADRYITQHIAEGMGELFHLGIADNQPALKPIADNAIKYLDDQLIADENNRKKNKQEKYYGDLEIHAWYTRSFFLDKTLNSGLQKMRDGYLKWAVENWVSRDIYEQGLIALTMQRYKKQEVTVQIERSLLETARQSDDLGMYWAKNQQGYFWYERPVETQSLLIELFTEAGDNAKAVDEMKIWLLRNKQTNNWKTTTATAAACYALLLKSSDLLSDTGKSAIKLDGKALEQLKPDVKTDAGTGYIKTSWADEQIKPAFGKVEISNSGKNISWGALHWQYLENLDKITSAPTNINLERRYYIQKQTDAGPVLTAVDATHLPKTGDLLKVVVHLKADRDFEYVQLKDMRPAGTEPVEALSAYKYQDGLYYYQVSKDVATNFFISYLNKGTYVFEYQLRVAQPGNFSTGITSVQCMYAPEFSAHSPGERMVVKP